uniref:Uncharacterized protein n=1 Tax=Pristhesancus plagipennis TaxID=1955184 RepID=A0A2K8JME4_PRIPG|nr:secreted hypothetical protein [Pristhesancus plagipennis]
MWTILNIAVLQVLLLTAGCLADESGRLRKVPRIYNALITTNENLLPSQAYPAVSPVLHPTSHIYVEHKGISSLPPIRESQTHPQSEPRVPPPPLIPIQLPDLEESPNVKNNRPADSSIPDVPPPPLPVTFKN